MHPCAFGERLREERDRLGLNQEELGLIGGVNRNTQGKYEKGERSPDTKYLEAIAAAGVDILYLVTGRRTPLPAGTLSLKESTMVEKYRSLGAADQASLDRLVDALAETAGIYNAKR